jgi:hypothetical protein
VIFRYDVSRTQAGGSIGLLHKELGMSREDDFDDIMDTPDETEAGQDDTSGMVIDETSSVEEPVEVEVDAIIITEEEEMPAPAAPARKAAKKKKVAKKKVAKKKVAKKVATKKVAKKKVAKKKVAKKKVAKKKTRPAPKKKARRKK